MDDARTDVRRRGRRFRRCIGVVSAAALVTAAALAPAASAQWAYRPYGWGGWGGAASIQGDTARGMGVFAAGAGQYNEQTAIANSINADTRMRLNEYIWRSEQINRKENYDRMAREAAQRREAAGEIEQRQLYKPQRQDIVSGDALNAILHQLRSPSVPDSLLALLSEDGRLVAVLREGATASARLYVRSGRGVAGHIDFNAVLPPLPGLLRQPGFEF